MPQGPADFPLILASASPARRALLESAGLAVTVQPADIDEAPLRTRWPRTKPMAALATALAREKAQAVGRSHPGYLVLGADQLCLFENDIFGKPGSVPALAQQLRRLRGATHRLISAAVLVRDGVEVWAGHDSADLTMRSFSDLFLEDYLEQCGATARHCAGGYQIEGFGAQLFESVRGDYFTIMGLPLLPVLAALRREKVVAE